MSTELKMLAWSMVLGLVNLIIATQAATRQRGFKWNFSPRDQKMPDLTGIAGRLDRAFRNFMETFVFFLGAVLLVTLTKTENGRTELGSQLYFFARLLYIPIYALGIPMVRSLVWITSFVGIVLVLTAAFGL